MFSPSSLKKMALALLLILALAPIKFSALSIPVTLQTLVIFCCACFLNWRQTAIVVFTYLMLGALGLPVFAGYSGGWAKLTGPTAGFLWGFPFVAAGLSWQMEYKKPNFFYGIIYFFIAHAILLVPGFLVLNYSMPEAKLWPTFVLLIPGLLVKSILGGIIGAYAHKNWA